MAQTSMFPLKTAAGSGRAVGQSTTIPAVLVATVDVSGMISRIIATSS